MINWILGGLIFSLVIVIVVKNVRRLQKGETACSGCSLQETTNCSCPHRDTQ
ncbi:FeoB-associated Cys-rich membrane protein [Paenibacillus glacialis]|uniref:FeoB-associated Cys-rich membrane protein n=1 Tax=Paenibacillus glacialis TaxID=494026 RepID=UPI000B1B7EE5|nr:FeoB-associated Cys-rich membrane protein [Paenibacillus glacialis]